MGCLSSSRFSWSTTSLEACSPTHPSQVCETPQLLLLCPPVPFITVPFFPAIFSLSLIRKHASIQTEVFIYSTCRESTMCWVLGWANEYHDEISYISTKTAKIKGGENAKCFWWCIETGYFITCWWECDIGTATVGNNLTASLKTKHLWYSSTNALLDTYAEELKMVCLPQNPHKNIICSFIVSS